MKCHGSATVGERGQLVLPADLRKLFGIKAGDRLIVLGSDCGGMQSIALIKSEDLAKMFEFMEEMEGMLKEGGKDFESFREEGLKKMLALKESGLNELGKAGKRKKK
jgi:AbrB family looped-hinge helix DNA binding protein